MGKKFTEPLWFCSFITSSICQIVLKQRIDHLIIILQSLFTHHSESLYKSNFKTDHHSLDCSSFRAHKTIFSPWGLTFWVWWGEDRDVFVLQMEYDMTRTRSDILRRDQNMTACGYNSGLSYNNLNRLWSAFCVFYDSSHVWYKCFMTNSERVIRSDEWIKRSQQVRQRSVWSRDTTRGWNWERVASQKDQVNEDEHKYFKAS